MPFLHPAVCRQVGVAHPFHPSLLLGDVLSRLCGWSCFRPPTMPGQGSPLVSASGQVFVYRSPSPFRVPRRPARPSLRTRCRSFWGEVIAAARAARPPVGSLRAHKSAACPPLSRSTVTGRFPLSLISHLGLQFGVFLILSSRHSTRI